MNFGKINQYMLFGGGELLCLTARQLQQESFSVFVVTSERHSNELVTIEDENLVPLTTCLRNYCIDYVISKDVSQDSNVIDKITENTLGISFGAAWIFKKRFIDLFHGRLVNCHGARLPQDRGAGGFSWRIMRDDRVGACLIHQIDTGVDTGDILLYEEYVFPEDCRYPIDYQTYSVVRYQNLLRTFFDLVNNERSFRVVAQQENLSSYWPRLATDIHGYIDWNWDIRGIERFICAFDEPYKGASTFWKSNKVRLKKCYAYFGDGVFHPFQGGLIYRISDTMVFVAAGHGTLLVLNVMTEDNVDIKRKLSVGDRFYTPIKYLEEAKRFRAIYTASGLKE